MGYKMNSLDKGNCYTRKKWRHQHIQRTSSHLLGCVMLVATKVSSSHRSASKHSFVLSIWTTWRTEAVVV